jgi:hypothetical protein
MAACAHPAMSNRRITIQRSRRMRTIMLMPDHVQCSNRKAPTDPSPEHQASGSLRNGHALYVTAHCTGKRRDGRIVKSMRASQGGSF